MAIRESIVKIYGGQLCDYGFYVTGDLTATQLATFQANDECPDWDSSTEFKIDFLNGLVAGNASFGDNPPTEYKIYRKIAGEASLVLAATIDGTKESFTDYAVANDTTYSYYIYPSDDESLGTPIETQSITTAFKSWQLLVVDDTDEDGVYTLSQIYKFDFNPDDVQLQNNTTVNKLRNFTNYLKLQRDSTNCWTGTLSSLTGVYDCATHQYSESLTMFDAVKTLSTDLRKKFLRDFDGHLYEIDVSSPIEMSQKVFANGRMTTKKLEWTEIGDASSVQIVADGDLD